MYEYNAEIIRVVDGDTLEAMVDLGFSTWTKEKLRLAGIDTPELRDSDPDAREAAQRAKVRVTEILGESPPGRFGPKVKLRIAKTAKGTERRTFGRYVATVILLAGIDSKPPYNLGDKLIAEGLAVKWPAS